MSAITITISSPGRAIVADGRLVAGESADVSVVGAVPAALYLVDASRDVVAACTSFVAGESSATGELNLATVPLAEIVAEIPAGRAIPLQAILDDADGSVVGYGLVAVVSAPMPDALDPLDDDFIYAKLSDLRDYLTRAEADERYAPIATAVRSVNGVTPTDGEVTLDAHDVGALSMSEAVAGYTDWAVDPPTYGGHALEIYHDLILGKYMLADAVTGGVLDTTADGSYPADDATSLSFAVGTGYTATRTRLRPTEAQEAAWDAKQGALTSAQLANIAAVPFKADAADLRYAQGATITASAQLADRTGNIVIPLDTNTENIVLTFPDAVAGYLRDFLVLVTYTSGYGGQIFFALPLVTVYGDGLANSPAIGETWLYSFTEVAADTFWVKSVKMEVAQ